MSIGSIRNCSAWVEFITLTWHCAWMVDIIRDSRIICLMSVFIKIKVGW